jgi:LacI family transcriptional regulator
LQAAEYAIPDDLSVIVFDDFEHAHTFQLTAVAYPLVQIGREAVRMMVEHINEPNLERTHRFFRTKLVERASCAPPAHAPRK